MSELNRRNALIAAAVLPALAVPAAAESEDAELFVLGQEFDRLADMLTVSFAHLEAAHKQAEAMFPTPPDTLRYQSDDLQLGV